MKRIYVVVALSLCATELQAQNAKPDTIKFYTHILLSAGPNGYFINDQRVPKSRYDFYKNNFDQIDKCTPCWARNYEMDETLFSEGLFYTDCPAGEYIEYYESGIVKIKGFYTENKTGDWKNWYNRGGCRKGGEWKYYDENSVLIKSENYKNGELVK